LDEQGDITDCWQDFLSIPQGRTICEGKITLSSLSTNANEKAFFNSQIRIKQCDNSAICGENNKKPCDPTLGVTGKLVLTPEQPTNLATLYWQLIREGKLVCAGGGDGCLTAIYGSQLPVAKCTDCDYCPVK